MESVISSLAFIPWFGWIAIVAIISGTVSGIMKMSMCHRERMAMIQQGMHPDSVTAKPQEYSEV